MVESRVGLESIEGASHLVAEGFIQNDGDDYLRHFEVNVSLLDENGVLVDSLVGRLVEPLGPGERLPYRFTRRFHRPLQDWTTSRALVTEGGH
ncbi:MAG: FxLYD domain-containing protein [Acidobacteriota bacterium]